jgi:hypothetical protein
MSSLTLLFSGRCLCHQPTRRNRRERNPVQADPAGDMTEIIGTPPFSKWHR